MSNRKKNILRISKKSIERTDVMQLIISEKPSTAKTIAAVVGANEKEYDGKEFCYKGNGYYVVNARGHLYSLGMPEDYGYSKVYRLDELPMFPTFELFPECENTNGLRRIIGKLINLPLSIGAAGSTVTGIPARVRADCLFCKQHLTAEMFCGKAGNRDSGCFDR